MLVGCPQPRIRSQRRGRKVVARRYSSYQSLPFFYDLFSEYDEYSKRAKIYTEIHAARGPKAEVSRKRSDNSTEPNASAERDKKGKMEKLAKDKKRTLKRL